MRHLLLAWTALIAVGCGAHPGVTPRAPRAESSPEPVQGHASPPGPENASPPTEAPDEETESEEPIEDGAEAPAPAAGETRAHPLDGWSQSQLEQRWHEDPPSLGSISWGQPGAGALLNGVRMPAGPYHSLNDPAHAWGTQETVESLLHCLERVHERWPNAPPVAVGHLSAQRGGPLSPHVSHQSGRDADVGYYFQKPGRPFARATASNLDPGPTWTLVRALITETDVDLIIIDQSLQKELRAYALGQGEDQAWLRSVFQGAPGGTRPLVIHARGHATHLHVRFTSPLARETARRLGPLLTRQRVVSAPQRIVTHKARPGDTLGNLARRYRTTVRAIMQANGLSSARIRAGRVYRIPVPARAGTAGSSGGPVVVEKRRVPPPG